jgi:hypothetical protein
MPRTGLPIAFSAAFMLCGTLAHGQSAPTAAMQTTAACSGRAILNATGNATVTQLLRSITSACRQVR